MKTLLLLLTLTFTLMAPTPSAAQKGDPQKHIDREAFFARRNAYITAMMPLREAIRLPTTAVHLDFYTFAP